MTTPQEQMMKTQWLVGVAGMMAAGVMLVATAAEPAAAEGVALAEQVKAAAVAETVAKADYAAFAAKADEEGYKSVAALFRAAAESQRIHLAKHEAVLKVLGVAVKPETPKSEVKTTKENLEKTLADKKAVVEKTTPERIKAAEAAKNHKAVISFKGALAADGEYVKLFADALAGLDGWKAAGKEFYVCEVCAFVMTDPKLAKCPICESPRTKFETFK